MRIDGSAVAEDAHGELVADHHLLHQQLAVVACRQRDRLIEAGLVGDG